MRVACQRKPARARGLVLELEAEGQEEGAAKVNEGAAVAQQAQGGGLVLKIGHDRAILASGR
jgi:hypothetical protein